MNNNNEEERDPGQEERMRNYENFMNQKKQQEMARQRKTKTNGGSENRLKSLVFKPRNSLRTPTTLDGDFNNDREDTSN
jgi:hypothetical protein